MSTGKNINNALHVLYKTYENVNKLMDSCASLANECGYVKLDPKFLRWKAEYDPNGWLVSSFILLFKQKNEESDQGSGARIYVADICLAKSEEREHVPAIYLSRFEYDNGDVFVRRISPADHWAFYYPVHRLMYFTVTRSGDVRTAVPNGPEISAKYWGLKEAVTQSVPLEEITSENLKEKIFVAFDRLN